MQYLYLLIIVNIDLSVKEGYPSLRKITHFYTTSTFQNRVKINFVQYSNDWKLKIIKV